MTDMRAWQGGLFGLAIAGAVALACTTDYQKGVDDPLYGGPNALANQKAPGSTGDTLPAADGSAPASGPACGTPVADAGACTVSFKTQIFPTLTATCLGAGCHSNTPPLIAADAPTTYDTFVKFKISDGEAIYVNPCTVDDTKSKIVCNLQGKTGCGTKMPLSKTYADTDIANITTWLKCGAPNN